jgi:tRNA threonylcarbamoyladenosine biosynthesis protein TsaE
VTKSPFETQAIAEKLASGSTISFEKKGNVILLTGDVGAGKTTFVRGFMKYWNLESQVGSPTFTVMNVYENQKIRVCHFDLYRFQTKDEIEEIGFEDFIENSHFSLIEWPEIALPTMDYPIKTISMRLGKTEFERIIEIKN